MRMTQLLSNTPPAADSGALWEHFSATYFSLRAGLALLGLALPFVLYLVGKWGHDLDLQPSMSAYFWAAAKNQCATFPMRTIFVGFLFAIGVGLYVYKGLTALENTLLNAAAICALVVAIYPERLPAPEAARDPRVLQLFENCPAINAWASQPSLPIHNTAAFILFALLAIAVWLCANKSLEYLPIDRDPKKFRRAYNVIAIAMILFPVSGVAVALLLGAASEAIFFIEAAGIVTFGVYWAVKTYELSLSRLERDPVKALEYAAQRRAQTRKAQ